ncbi:interferon gamma receptor 2 isoform X2 [Dromaius novaehollandiae]|uniref:interferon gamma receptor 2 isoform X2 n=1 Tax=Dromaius novaehollandiae TaxID=8790 RepID=UPI000E1E8DCB|nr:interferon gamma receptor 2 isoform X2 [Dromaius novaehollandiae]
MPCRALCLFLLLLLLLLLGPAWATAAASSIHLPAPQSVMVYSYNFRSSLRWSPVKVDRGPVLYTVHFKTGAFNQWDEMNCTHITQTECNFPQFLNERRWTIILRVRAELGQMVSDWVESDPFVAERNTTIGPPKVNSVIVSSDSLLVSVIPPFGSELGDFLQYRVSYWENSTSTTEKETKMSNTLFKIMNLKELTLYCFKVQVEFMIEQDVQIRGLQSVPECYRTTVSVGLFLMWRYHNTIKYWSQPPFKIPSHFEEYLKDPSMPVLEALENCTEEDPCDSLSVVCNGEKSQECDSTAEGKARSHSSSSESELT